MAREAGQLPFPKVTGFESPMEMSQLWKRPSNGSRPMASYGNDKTFRVAIANRWHCSFS